MTLFDSGIRPAIDAHLLRLAQEKRDYGNYWSASSAGYCMRRLIFERLGVPHVTKDDDARKQRVFTAGHIFHEWIQKITKDSGLSVAQELELQDEDLMVRGHIDDLVLVDVLKEGAELEVATKKARQSGATPFKSRLILYDYKTRNSRNFNFSKTLSYYHKMQLGTYMYMLRKERAVGPTNNGISYPDLTEARILNIEKDTLRMSEVQLLWSEESKVEIEGYWSLLNMYWKEKKLPRCTCADHENGFLAKEQYNPYFYNGEPCSIEPYKQFKEKENIV